MMLDSETEDDTNRPTPSGTLDWRESDLIFLTRSIDQIEKSDTTTLYHFEIDRVNAHKFGVVSVECYSQKLW